MHNLKPMLVGSILAASFSTLAFAQNTRDNVHYNIHQKGEQNTSQTGDSNQAAQNYGSGNASATEQSGSQNQNATGTGIQQSEQYGSKNSSAQNEGSGSASAGASTDSDRHGKGDRYGKSDERHDNGKHKGWSKNGKDRD